MRRLLANRPAPGSVVEIDAFRGSNQLPAIGFGRAESMSQCPSTLTSPLTDQPYTVTLGLLNGVSSNALPADAPFLLAAAPPENGERSLADGLPYHARVRGYLGDPAYDECPQADRIFVVQEVVRTYEASPPTPEYPKPGSPDWPRYENAGLGFSLPQPPDWDVTEQPDGSVVLRAARWPEAALTIRVLPGETTWESAETEVAGTAGGIGAYSQLDENEGDPMSAAPLEGLVIDCEAPENRRCVDLRLNHAGQSYSLRMEFPVGFDASQDLLWTYTAIAEGLRVANLATKTPVPTEAPPLREIGSGQLVDRDQAAAGLREDYRMQGLAPYRLGSGRLMSEAAAAALGGCPQGRARNRWDEGAPRTLPGRPAGVWGFEITLRHRDRAVEGWAYVDAATGQFLCTSLDNTPFTDLTPTPEVGIGRWQESSSLRVEVSELRAPAWGEFSRPENGAQSLVSIVLYNTVPDPARDMMVDVALGDGAELVKVVLKPAAAEVLEQGPDRLRLRLAEVPAYGIVGPISFVADSLIEPATVRVLAEGKEVTAAPAWADWLDVNAMGMPWDRRGPPTPTPLRHGGGGWGLSEATPPATSGRWWCGGYSVYLAVAKSSHAMAVVPCHGPAQPGSPVEVLFRADGSSDWIPLPELGAITANGNHAVIHVSRAGDYQAFVSAADRDRGVASADPVRGQTLRAALAVAAGTAVQDEGRQIAATATAWAARMPPEARKPTPDFAASRRVGTVPTHLVLRDPLLPAFIQAVAGGSLPERYTVAIDTSQGDSLVLACQATACTPAERPPQHGAIVGYMADGRTPIRVSVWTAR